MIRRRKIPKYVERAIFRLADGDSDMAIEVTRVMLHSAETVGIRLCNAASDERMKRMLRGITKYSCAKCGYTFEGKRPAFNCPNDGTVLVKQKVAK